MTLLELAARAIAQGNSDYAHAMMELPPVTSAFDTYDDADKESVLQTARAVLLAIREPSDAMVDAANDSISDEYECGLAWREMIDAALGE